MVYHDPSFEELDYCTYDMIPTKIATKFFVEISVQTLKYLKLYSYTVNVDTGELGEKQELKTGESYSFQNGRHTKLIIIPEPFQKLTEIKFNYICKGCDGTIINDHALGDDHDSPKAVSGSNETNWFWDTIDLSEYSEMTRIYIYSGAGGFSLLCLLCCCCRCYFKRRAEKKEMERVTQVLPMDPYDVQNTQIVVVNNTANEMVNLRNMDSLREPNSGFASNDHRNIVLERNPTIGQEIEDTMDDNYTEKDDPSKLSTLKAPKKSSRSKINTNSKLK